MTATETWRLLDTGASSGDFNMHADAVLLEAVGAGCSPSVFRLYRWDPPAISLGYNQDPKRELNLPRVRSAGIEVVRRLTGGRAVLHWEELTYSVICREGCGRLGTSPGATYREIGKALVAGLRAFGAPVDMHRQDAGQGGRSTPEAPKPPCFASTSKWDVTYRGRKLVGSAQRRIRGAILQHGSILTGPRHLLLDGFLRAANSSRPDADLPVTPSSAIRNPGQSAAKDISTCASPSMKPGSMASAHLGEIFGEPVDIPTLSACIAGGLGGCLEIDLRDSALAPGERAEIERRCGARQGVGEPEPVEAGTQR